MHSVHPESGLIDLEILREALVELEDLTDVSVDITRLRAERLKRPRSTVYRITDPTWPSGVSLFYKSFDPPPSENGRPDSIRAGITRSRDLSNRMAEQTRHLAVNIARVLAAEPSALTIVTLGVPGRPLSERLRVPPLGSRRSELNDQFRNLGEAISIGESGGSEAVAAFDKDRIWRRMERHLQLVPEALGIGIPELMEFADSLLQQAIQSSPPRFTHGDISPTNILSKVGEVSLIDFRWVSRLPTFDLALMSYRAHRAGRLRPGMTTALNRALLAGYMNGIPDFPEAAFKLNCWMMAARSLNSRDRQLRARGLRAIIDMYTRDDAAGNMWWWETSV